MAMDIIFRVHEQEFISDLVDFGKFLVDAIEVRQRAFTEFGENGERKANPSADHFGNFSDLDVETSDAVLTMIDINNLRSTHVHYNFRVTEPSPSIILPSTWHKTLSYLKKEHEKKKNPQYKSVSNRLLKYDRVELSLLTVPRYDFLTDCEATQCTKGVKKELDEEYDDQKICDEIIVTCSVYYGYSRPLQYDERRLGRLMKVTDKLQLLGSSTLLDLKNAFQCPSDISFGEDMSLTMPHPSLLSKFRYPNSYFFIHDTFYVDDSVDESLYEDLSLVVRQWTFDKEFIGEMKVASMNTNLVDIRARLGMPYLYVHQGQCEHLICFTDVRLWEYRDPVHVKYPIKMQEKNFRRTCCIGCKMNTAEWVIIESERLPFTPAFVCQGCYEEFNFTKEGFKIDEFKAVPFCDRKAMDKNGNLFTQKLINICKKMEDRIVERGGINPAAPFFILPFQDGILDQVDKKPDKNELDVQMKEEKKKKKVITNPPIIRLEVNQNDDYDLMSL